MISPSDKITRFSNLDELKTAIELDLTTREVNAQRYCVRFIMLNNFETFRNLTSFLCKDLNVARFEIQNLLPDNDKTITIDKLSNAVKGITQSSIVTPFSELVRFYRDPEFMGFFNDIILTEDLKNPHKRIYIPIIGLNNRFIDFLKNFGRIEESAPIWQLYSPIDDKVKVFISKLKSTEPKDFSEYITLNSMKEWLDFWRKQAPQEKILCSAAPIRIGWRNSRPDSIFTFTEISNSHELITEFQGITIPFEFKEAEIKLWDNLQETIYASQELYFSWKKHVEDHFGTYKFSITKILEIWADTKTTEFDRWLLKNYILHTDTLKDNKYFKDCLLLNTKYNEEAALFVELAERIFYTASEAEREKYYSDRAKLLREEKEIFLKMVPASEQDWIKDRIISYSQDDKTFHIAKKLTTGTFDFEKELFFGWFKFHSDLDFGIEHLKYYYPDLYGYLKTDTTRIYQSGAEWLANYFDEYRNAKIKDKYTEGVKNYIEKYNQDDATFWDWYFKHNKCHDLYHMAMNDTIRKPDRIYWIDGLGAEFIPFIFHLIETSSTKYEVIEAELATTGLPSNTDLNRFDVDNKTHFKFGGLDTLAHSGNYNPRKTLIEELGIIREIITNILKDNSIGEHTIAIVSDHGLSALSRLCTSKKMTGDSHHEGRYILNTSDIASLSMPEYISCTNPVDNKDYKVALKHFSLGKRPTHEVHGGCTPEEVLVPFILISNHDLSKSIKYDINCLTTDIPKSNPVFKCIIIPTPDYAQLIVGNKRIPMTVENTTWSARIPEPEEGHQNVGVLPSKGKVNNFKINIYGLGLSNSNSFFDNDF